MIGSFDYDEMGRWPTGGAVPRDGELRESNYPIESTVDDEDRKVRWDSFEKFRHRCRSGEDQSILAWRKICASRHVTGAIPRMRETDG